MGSLDFKKDFFKGTLFHFLGFLKLHKISSNNYRFLSRNHNLTKLGELLVTDHNETYSSFFQKGKAKYFM
jgi:hypothetical protein